MMRAMIKISWPTQRKQRALATPDGSCHGRHYQNQIHFDATQLCHMIAG